MRIQHQTRGFTLIELSLVLLVLSIMIGGIMGIVTENIRSIKRTELQTKLAAIQEALLVYSKVNKRLPCPGDLTATMTSAEFGVMGEPAGACIDGSPASNFSSVGETAYGGAVPVRALGLPLEYAFDPWGNHFLYSVDRNMTLDTDPLPFLSSLPTSTSVGVFTILDLEDDANVSNAIYTILSHGPNGHGAYGINGTRKNNNSTNTMEQENCDCTSSAVSGTYNATFYQSSASSSTTALNNFDDILIYATREQMLSEDDSKTEF